MASYKIKKVCRTCRKSFVVMNGNSRQMNCDECMQKLRSEAQESQSEGDSCH